VNSFSSPEIQSVVPNYYQYNDGLKMKDHIRRDMVDEFEGSLGTIAAAFFFLACFLSIFLSFFVSFFLALLFLIFACFVCVVVLAYFVTCFYYLLLGYIEGDAADVKVVKEEREFKDLDPEQVRID
jgi:hypothetical protein